MRIVVGISGASGALYGIRLLEELEAESFLVVSEAAREVLRHEVGMTAAQVKRLAAHAYADGDLTAPIASGSFLWDAMVIVPCSMTTLAKIALGLADTLITRAAAVSLKEHRPLVLVPRETPLSPIHLEHMAALARLGVTILPASPGLYLGQQTAQEVVDTVVARILDTLRLPHELAGRWGEQAGLTGRSGRGRTRPRAPLAPPPRRALPERRRRTSRRAARRGRRSSGGT